MDPLSMDPYLSIANLYQQLDALVPVCISYTAHNFSALMPQQANPSTPLVGSENDCIALLTLARSARDEYIGQRESSHQDMVAMQERLKIHKARVQHYAATINVVEDFIGEARSRFRARGIPIHPTSIPSDVNLINPPDPSSQPHDTGISFATLPEHIQESAGRILAVTDSTSEKVRAHLAYSLVSSYSDLVIQDDPE